MYFLLSPFSFDALLDEQALAQIDVIVKLYGRVALVDCLAFKALSGELILAVPNNLQLLRI